MGGSALVRRAPTAPPWPPRCRLGWFRGRGGRFQQGERLHPEAFGQTLDGAKAEVLVPPLDGADVGAVHPEELGEGFLGQGARQAMSANVPAQRVLQVALHGGKDNRFDTEKSTYRWVAVSIWGRTSYR